MANIHLLTDASQAGSTSAFDWLLTGDYSDASESLTGTTVTISGNELRGLTRSAGGLVLNFPDGTSLLGNRRGRVLTKKIGFDFANPVAVVGARVSALLSPSPSPGQPVLRFRVRIDVTDSAGTTSLLGTREARVSRGAGDPGDFLGAISSTSDISAVTFTALKIPNGADIKSLVLGPLVYRVAKAGAAGGGG